MEKHGAQRERVLAMLREAGGLHEDAVRRISEETGVPEADVWGAGSFYELIRHADVQRRVCQGLSCVLQGAMELEGEKVSCLGQCDRAPVVIGEDFGIVHAGGPRGAVTPDDPKLPMNLGGVDRQDYAALARARALGPDAVIAALDGSGLQGRGGAGFPAGIKWKAVRNNPPGERYVVCNADEGEPGTFKDREIMLRRPHLLVEGLAIAAETGWPEERVLFMPLARLAQYQHCLFRRNSIRTTWSSSGSSGLSLKDQITQLRLNWQENREGPRDYPRSPP